VFGSFQRTLTASGETRFGSGIRGGILPRISQLGSVLGERHAGGGRCVVHGASLVLIQSLKSHSRIHAAEGELFRRAIRRACEAVKIPVTEVRARELPLRAGEILLVSPAEVPQRLAAIGRTAGRPWAKDQKESLLAALVVLSVR